MFLEVRSEGNEGMKRWIRIMLSIVVMILATGNLCVYAKESDMDVTDEAAESTVDGITKETSEEPVEAPNEEISEEVLIEEKKAQTIQVSSTIHKFYGEQFVIEAKPDGGGELVFEAVDTGKAPVIKKLDENGTFEAVGVGKATVKIIAKETDNYKEAVRNVTVVIAKAKPQITTKDVKKKYNLTPFQMKVATDIAIKDDNVRFSWRSLNSKIASVTSKGTVTIHRMGTVVLRVASKGTDHYEPMSKDIKLIVVSSLSKPTIKKAELQTNGMMISWQPVERAEGYRVYRKDSNGYKIILNTHNPGITSCVDTDVSVGKIYYYRVKAYRDGEKDLSEWCDYKKCKFILPPNISVGRTSSGLQVRWEKSSGAEGYYIYRKENGESKWTRKAKITSGSTLLWKDKTVPGGKKYTYMIRAYNRDSVSAYSKERSYYRLSAPKITSWKRRSKTSYYLKWNRVSGASGYQIQYSRSSVFKGTKTITIANTRTVAKTITRLSKDKKYYPRIRAYATVDGKKYYSPWYLTKGVKSEKRASLSIIKKQKKKFELRGQSGQALYQYDTVQGGCSDGTYAYYIMNNRKIEKCKIVKVRLSDMKVIKVSGALKIDHGTDMTYNSKIKRLVVVHKRVNPKRLSLINPNTLKVEKMKDVKMPSVLPGASSSDLKGIKGFFTIAYNRNRNQYAAVLSKTYHIMILDGNMNPITYIKPSKKMTYLLQSMEVTNDYILVGQSPKAGTGQKYNIISVYDWEGNYISRVLVKKGCELENIFYKGNQLYASFYTSYYKTYYTTERKLVREKGQLKVKKEKVRHRKLMRDNYVYKVGAF